MPSFALLRPGSTHLISTFVITSYSIHYTKLYENSVRVFFLSRLLKCMDWSPFSIIENNVYLSDAKNLRIGKNCQINENVFIQGATIGDDVLIAPHVSILSTTHNFERVDVPIVVITSYSIHYTKLYEMKVLLFAPVNDEKLCLDIQLKEGNSWIDEIHVTEFDRTFQGKYKGFYLKRNNFV